MIPWNITRILTTSLALALSFTAAQQASNAPKTTTLLSKPLQGIEGKEGLMTVIDFPPGASAPAHRHNANVFVYVLEGSIVTQLEGQALVTLTAGQTYTESPTDTHRVARNASETAPARMLVFFVKDQGVPPLVPVK
jgi:quercetin dioxygenase-like cupin family protein